MKLTRKAWIWIICGGLFGLWWGIPTFNKWRADKLVDELCAKNGGVKVYETVTLPKERFNQWGQFQVRDEKDMMANDDYYSVWNITNIEGRQESSDIGALAVYQSRFLIYRIQDKKLLAEMTSYVRTGGDPQGPWHPSSYRCPALTNFEEKVFKPLSK
jgi:hypothetical protein